MGVAIKTREEVNKKKKRERAGQGFGCLKASLAHRPNQTGKGPAYPVQLPKVHSSTTFS